MAALAAGALAGIGSGIISDVIGNEYANGRQTRQIAATKELQRDQLAFQQGIENRARFDANELGINYALLPQAKAPTYQSWNGQQFTAPSIVSPSAASRMSSLTAQSITKGLTTRPDAGRPREVRSPTTRPSSFVPPVPPVVFGRSLPYTPSQMAMFESNNVPAPAWVPPFSDLQRASRVSTRPTFISHNLATDDVRSTPFMTLR